MEAKGTRSRRSRKKLEGKWSWKISETQNHVLKKKFYSSQSASLFIWFKLFAISRLFWARARLMCWTVVASHRYLFSALNYFRSFFYPSLPFISLWLCDARNCLELCICRDLGILNDLIAIRLTRFEHTSRVEGLLCKLWILILFWFCLARCKRSSGDQSTSPTVVIKWYEINANE